MKVFRSSLCLAAAMVVLFCVSASAAPRCERWWSFAESGALPAIDEVLASLGTGERIYRDELLALDIHEYELSGADCRGAATGKIYASGGEVIGLSTIYAPDHRSRLGRFVLEHYDEILVLGDLVAIAGARENCAEYRAVAAMGECAEVFRLSAALYGRMVAVGDLPPIPPENARKGYAA